MIQKVKGAFKEPSICKVVPYTEWNLLQEMRILHPLKDVIKANLILLQNCAILLTLSCAALLGCPHSDQNHFLDCGMQGMTVRLKNLGCIRIYIIRVVKPLGNQSCPASVGHTSIFTLRRKPFCFYPAATAAHNVDWQGAWLVTPHSSSSLQSSFLALKKDCSIVYLKKWRNLANVSMPAPLKDTVYQIRITHTAA